MQGSVLHDVLTNHQFNTYMQNCMYEYIISCEEEHLILSKLSAEYEYIQEGYGQTVPR
jgi:hypothetical protein